MRTLCNIRSDDDEKYYFLLVTWKDDGKEGFDLLLTNAVKAWKSSVSSDHLDKCASAIHMKFFEYVTLTKAALTGIPFDQTIFVYQVKPRGCDVEFIWKKFLPTENIKFQLGNVTLSEVNDSVSAFENIFSFCCKEIKELQENLQTLKCENEKLVNDRTDALKRLENCVEIKEESEQFLFFRFVKVLNEKKAKIRSLKSELEKLKIDPHPKKNDNYVKDDDETDMSLPSSPVQSMREGTASEYEDDTEEDDKPTCSFKPSQSKKAIRAFIPATTCLDQSQDEDLIVPKRRKCPAPKKSPVVSSQSNKQVASQRTVSCKSSRNVHKSSSEIDALLEKL